MICFYRKTNLLKESFTKWHENYHKIKAEKDNIDKALRMYRAVQTKEAFRNIILGYMNRKEKREKENNSNKQKEDFRLSNIARKYARLWRFKTEERVKMKKQYKYKKY